MTSASGGPRRRLLRTAVALAVAAMLLATVVVLLRWHPFGWKGVERAGWIAGIASGVLSAISTVAAVVALRPRERVGGPVTAVPSPVTRSRYVRQIQLLSPATLVDREEELAELAWFCRSDRPPYVWWQAPAWAGKSALMAWFALHPPPGVRVAAFFITARYARQNDRVGFTDVVLEQLAEMLGQPMPSFLTDSTRDAHFHGMLADAAEACRRRGERLVLLVDGLDEDRGVTEMPATHSIAALLPADPPAGLRVVVAGRVDRPVPADVSSDHPLRDPATVRLLQPSPYATVVREDAERELKSLLAGTAGEQEQLAFLTISGGGLTAADLAALTGRPSWEVEDRFRTSSGRAFTCRPARWQKAMVYALGHEELQRDAVRYLGPALLAAFRDRLHTWASGYYERGWPPDTPEYLLSDYFWMTLETGDKNHVFSLATDRTRHDLMLRVSGGDALALAEIAAAQDFAAAAPDPDLTTVARLAAHRVHLTERGKTLPPKLPVLWARLGNVPRAEALARSIAAPARRAWALSAVAGVLASKGDTIGSAALADEAEAVAFTFSEADATAAAAAAVVEALATAGCPDRAERLARTIIEPSWRARALAAVGQATYASDHQRGNRLFTEAVTVADTTVVSDFRIWALAAVARAAAGSGDDARAVEVAERAAAVSPARDAIVEPWALDGVAMALVTVGELGRAEEIARTVVYPLHRTRALAAVAKAAAARGDQLRATTLAELAENAANSVTDWAERAGALVTVAGIVSADRATALMNRLEVLPWRTRVGRRRR